MEKIDVAIVGAGIIGLQIARELLTRNPSLVVCIFDKEKYIGEHTSGRNSGVIHSGLYYSQGSLKHELCISGNKQWKTLAASLDIPINYCGKFIIARNASEEEKLKELIKLAQVNEVEIEIITEGNELDFLKNDFNCSSAIFISSTGIIDQSTSLIKLRDEVTRLGGIILLSHELEKLNVVEDGVQLDFFNDLKLITKKVINCAGLGAVLIRKKLNLNDVDDYWVKGNYLKSSKVNNYKSLVYPVPLPDLKGLGIHLTFDFNNLIKFGPNTEDITTIDYSISEDTIKSMSENISDFMKEFDCKTVSPDYAGIRPKILLDKKLYSDFWIKEPIKNYIELLGIESPGFTASPAIANYVCQKFFNYPQK